MPRTQVTPEPNSPTTTHWAIGSAPEVLDRIHDAAVNIAIFERDAGALALRKEVAELVAQRVGFKAIGDVEAVMAQLRAQVDVRRFGRLIEDIQGVLEHFEAVTKSDRFRVGLTTVDTDMCRKFHVDINDIRLLCTYCGPGTQWLTDDNIAQEALHSASEDAGVALDEAEIRHAKTGAVVLLKGAMYPHPEARGVVHRSPVIEGAGVTRLLLRVDTNETINLWA